MTTNLDIKNLGIFWGKSSLFFVESNGLTPTVLFSIPFSSESSINPLNPEDSQLTADILKEVQKHNLTYENLFLSLPTKDIIFRSFIIPWMQQNEVNDVVEFEASKYIPFSLDELSYSFHSMLITEGTTKRIRIVFSAIKKTTLDTYTALLEQANLIITNVEPTPLSLIRCLISKDLLEVPKTLALIEKQDLSGRITIVSEGVPLFVREFKLTLPNVEEDTPSDDKSIFTRLINEIRISLDYFNRQEAQLTVSDLILLTPDQENLKSRIEADLKVPVTIIENSTILGDRDDTNLCYLNALGASLHNTVKTPANFDLLDEKIVVTARPTLTLSDFDFKSMNYKSIAITASICAVLIVGMFFFKKSTLNKLEAKNVKVETQLGIYMERKAEEIKTETATVQKELIAYKNIRLDSQIPNLLIAIPEALSKGTWLKNISFKYTPVNKSRGNLKATQKDKISITLDGFTYSENTKEHIASITQFVRNLKKIEVLTNEFENISIDSAVKQEISDHITTYFTLGLR
ncbi:MAG: Tfp pilus assembly PilM family ATPase [Candidatus Omnitrophota bacterium]|jgi:Tfp pilus assembly PilM family ATPase